LSPDLFLISFYFTPFYFTSFYFTSFYFSFALVKLNISIFLFFEEKTYPTQSVGSSKQVIAPSDAEDICRI
jgi:hypothetical protein